MQKYIAYYRVSTQKQGKSGLGLEAQKSLIIGFTKQNIIIAEFTDIETGKKNDRPELLKALEAAKREKATLVVAKLDRFSRSLTFISSVMDAKVKFVCADMPEANDFTLHIFAALAQQEAKGTSQRTIESLQALRERGVKLGRPDHMTHAAQKKGGEANRVKAKERNKLAASIAIEKKAEGKNLSEIAEYLNDKNIKTESGFSFYPVTVKRLIERAIS